MIEMKIKEILQKNQTTFSCEIFPPKLYMNIDKTKAVVDEICTLAPDFMSVTYGAGGGTSKQTVEIAEYINSKGMTALAHLTCASSNKEEVAAAIAKLKTSGIENVLALRGDIPEELKDKPRDYTYAYELVSEIKKQGDFCVGAACYPEGHVECESMEQDLINLKHKVDCGVDFLTTQMFFDNTAFYSFMFRALKKNIDVPIIAGIMPMTNSSQIVRSCKLSGATLPTRFRRIADKFGDNPEAMKQAGIAYATEQIIDLIANGVKGIHLYTMNKPDVAASIMSNLSYIVGADRICIQ